jgi:hypothetical protein
MIIQIPFQGFYQSIHEDAFDQELWSSMFTDSSGIVNNDVLSEAAVFNWQNVHTDYAKQFVEHVAHRYELNLTFESLLSPREYNFETDRIFCEITDESVMHMWRNTKRSILQKYITDYCTTRSGFHSFYANQLEEWPHNPLQYDHNQLYVLMMAYLDTSYDVSHGTYDGDILDDLQSNGAVSELMYLHLVNKRLISVHEYLLERAARNS